MTRWAWPVALVVSLAFLVVLLWVGLTGEGAPEGDLRNGQVFIQDNLWSTAHRQYAVWVGDGGTPFAAWRARGRPDWKIVDLGKLRGNPLEGPTADDTHNVYAIATDAGGGIHIAGNMHLSPLRYVRATADLSHFSTAPAPSGGPSVTYPAFTVLPDGTLLFWRREGQAGEGKVRLDALDPSATKWRSLGTIIDGTPTRESPYLNHIAVDARTGVIHLMFSWRSGPTVESTNDVGYARSADGGRTWQTADGTPLALPITHTPASTILNTQASGSGLVNNGGLTVDPRGRPHGMVVFDQPGGNRSWTELWFDGGSWRTKSFSDLAIGGRPQLAGTPDGRIWLLGARGARLDAVDVTPDRDPAPTQELARVPVGWEASYDSHALSLFGTVEMLIPDGDRPHVVVARLPDS
jgi:BNR repeat-containing family member